MEYTDYPTCGVDGLPLFPMLPMTKKGKAKKGIYHNRFGEPFENSKLAGAYHRGYRAFKRDAHRIAKRFNINFKIFKHKYGI